MNLYRTESGIYKWPIILLCIWSLVGLSILPLGVPDVDKPNRLLLIQQVQAIIHCNTEVFQCII